MKDFFLHATPALALFAFAGCTNASYDCGEHSVYATIDEGEKRVELILDSKALERAPAWDPASADPPLSVAKASRAAMDWARGEYTRYDSVEIREIVLAPYSCPSIKNRWYYRFDFTPIIDGNRVTSPGNFVAVLMDGSVVAPRSTR